MQRSCRSRKTKCQSLPASTAGEAIERMLVERKISTKINYDVLRDLSKGVSSQTCSSGSVEGQGESQAADTSQETLVISKGPLTPCRLPSIMTRKRSMSSVSGGFGGLPTLK